MNKVLSFVALGALLVACGPSIRVVKASKSGGVIALVGDRQGAMELARGEMARTCGGPSNYDIQEEGEAVIGEVSNTQGSASRNIFGVTGSSQTETTQKTEWRVTYSCKGAAPANNGTPPTTTTGGQPSGAIHTIHIPL